MKERLPSGTTFGRYQILSRVSAEGLGEVYLARDASSGAEVALKLLPASIAVAQNVRQRFLKVLAAIAKLRHKNLCEIYEFGIADNGRPFIAMEYVKGQSLDLLSYGHQLTVNDIVAFTIQIAETMHAFHSKGWLHLAVKPSNLMVSPARQAKILDLGLGLSFPPTLTGDADDPLMLTAGSARYLSPEQLTGETPDQRSDVFSLGCVVYELIAGHPPFGGSTVDEAAGEILRSEPAPLIDLVGGISPDLNRVIMKALARNRDDRYQTAGEMADELRGLNSRQSRFSKWAASTIESVQQGEGGKRRSEAATDPRGRAKTAAGDVKLWPGSFMADLKRAFKGLLDGAVKKGGGERIQLIRERSHIEDLALIFKKYWLRIAVIASTILGLIFAAMIVGNLREQSSTGLNPAGLRVSRVTGNGKVISAAISPYGDRIAYAIDEGAQRSLIIKDLKTNEERSIASEVEMEYRGLTFSPDGSSLAYVKAAQNDKFGGLFFIPAAGGSEEDVNIDNVIGAPSFSPDGKRVAIATANETGAETSINTCDLKGACQKVATKRSPDFFHPGGVSWSPDGNFISCVIRDAEGGLYLKLASVSIVDGTESLIASGRWSEIDRIVWLPSGSGLLAVASEPNAARSQLWHIAYPSGEISRITRDTNSYRGLSVTDRGDRILSVLNETWSNIRVAAGVEASRAEQLTKEITDGLNGLDWTPDNQIVYSSRAGGRETIWMTGLNAGGARPLPVAPEGGEGGEYQPSISHDGKYIVYIVDRSSGAYLWRSEPGRRNLKRLTDENLVFYPSISSDGGSVFYSVLREGRRVLAKSSIEGGAPATLVEKQAWRSSISPDGSRIVCNYWDDSNASWKIAVFRIEGGQPIAAFDAPGSFQRVVRWTPDGNGLAYIVTAGGVSNIWIQPLDGKTATKFTAFAAERIFDFAWSRDGQRIAYSQGTLNSDAILLQNPR